ncbi:MAG: hypothetical protein GY786_17715 [Proteobacteria bacterium]|nr:hypothetical protein [Pseudomonadota bacterium]
MILQNKFRNLFFSTLTSIFFVSCSQPISISDQYSQNYPEYTLETHKKKGDGEAQKISQGKSVVIIEEHLEENSDETLNSSSMEQQHTSSDNTLIEYKTSINTGYLEDSIRTNHAEGDIQTNAQNTTTFIEGKLFNLVEKAYTRRDEVEFLKLYNFFLETFPNTTRRSFLEEFRQSFFYTEGLNVDALEGTMVEFSFPEANSWENLDKYFTKLNRNGVASIQIPILQFLEQPVYLFAKQQETQGYYFKAGKIQVVDNVLDKLISMAHENNLKVLASFPLRNHPLLNDWDSYIMDDAWDPIQNSIFTTGKLDLLNPKGLTYIKFLLDNLLKTEIDGVIFQDDFTYELHEGFSQVARNRFRLMTGRNIDVASFLISYKVRKKRELGVLASNGFDAYINWRSREIKQSLWEIIDHARAARKGLTVGLEVTPEMLLNEKISKKWYSTSLGFLKDLGVDFFVLKKRKFNSNDEIDGEHFFEAAALLDSNINDDSSFYMKVELSKDTNNVILLNQKIDLLKNEFNSKKTFHMAIGPIDRLKNWSFLKYTHSAQQQSL